jgi:hypothetical protein
VIHADGLRAGFRNGVSSAGCQSGGRFRPRRTETARPAAITVKERSAGFQPAVSPNSIRQTVLNTRTSGLSVICGLEIRDTAGWKPALRPDSSFVGWFNLMAVLSALPEMFCTRWITPGKRPLPRPDNRSARQSR